MAARMCRLTPARRAQAAPPHAPAPTAGLSEGWLGSIDVARTVPTCVPACQVLGSRWYVKSRHRAGEVTLSNLWQPQQWLLGREWLLTARTAP